MKHWLTVLLLGVALRAYSGPAAVESVSVRTPAPENRNVTVYYRVPKDYDPARPESYRVLVIFGGRNCSGQAEAGGRLGWGAWADEQGVFLVSPGFKDDEYWDPQKWSGRALLHALGAIKKKYRICTGKLLYYGYSAGSQAANLFPAWRADLTRAWVSHACGVFHNPSARMKAIPGLVTCGDADISRYIISRRFVEENRRCGVNIIWKSFPNVPHDVPPDSLKLARAFLTYYHLLYFSDLSRSKMGRIEKQTVRFVGDDIENLYYPADSPIAKSIADEDRVLFPSEEIASAWGKEAK